MPSFRARLTNAFLRLRVRPLWKPGLDIQKIRRRTAKMDARIGGSAPPIASEPVEIAGVKATWYGEPALAARGTLLYLHGGAWIVHLPATYRRLAATLCGLTGRRVLLVDYRLAPEHPFPAAIDDCFAVKRWPRPADWAPIVRETLALDLVQHSLDLVDLEAPDEAVQR